MRHKKLVLFSVLLSIMLVVCASVFFYCQHRVKSLSRAYIVKKDDAPQCDAILVLGALVYESGQPSPVLQDRLDMALALYQAGKAPKIIVSGDHGSDEYDEVNPMLRYLMDRGVPRSDVFMDHAGFDTYDSMYRAREIFQAQSLLVSTQEFHIARSVYIARSLGINAWGVPSPDRESAKTYNNLRESLARVKAVLETEVLRRQSKQLGPATPVSGDGTVTDG